MPIRPPHPCGYRGCPALTHERYCEVHAAEVRTRYDKEHPREDSYYDTTAWRKLRGAFIKAHPVCVDPFGDHARAGLQVKANTVDHKVPREQGGRDSWDNLQALCTICHSRKSAVEGSRWKS